MRSLFLTLIYIFIMFVGVSASFVALLGYVWVDIFKPQELSDSLISGLPISMIAAALSLGMYFIADRKYAPRFKLVMFLIIVLAIWVTMTTYLSQLPVLPWKKWNWVIKVLIFSIFMPYVFRSRVHIEAFLLVVIFSVGAATFSAGIKTVLGSGGYGTLALLHGSNTGLGETSTLAAFCVMLIPIMDYMRNNSLIYKPGRFTNIIFIGMMVLAVITVVGTSARTGLVALFILLARYIMYTKKKFAWSLVLLVLTVAYTNIDLSNTKWGSRMSTIETYDHDSSALGRIAVWKWTLGFALENPLGGGFDSFRLNRIWKVTSAGITYFEPGVVWGKAFHNIYFEVLGEQGYFGLLVYLAIMGLTWRTLSKVRKGYKDNPNLEWTASLAKSLLDAMIVFLTAGMFFGIAYQPYIFYIIVVTISLDQYISRHKLISSGKKLT